MTSVMCIFTERDTPSYLGGSEVYRGSMPLSYLGMAQGWETQWDFFNNIWAQYAEHGPGYMLNFINQHDIFIFPRLNVMPEAIPNLANMFGLLREFKKHIVYECDDDYTNAHRTVVSGSAIIPAKWADAITVTTPYLAEIMRKVANRPVYVLPNCISPHQWAMPLDALGIPYLNGRFDGKVVIGLTGSPTHYHDWIVLRDVIHRILSENTDTHLLIGGYQPDYLQGIDDRCTFLQQMPYEHYSNMIKRCDIVLAPVDPDDQFNLSKSPIKAIEGMGAARVVPGDDAVGGALVIATDNPVYRTAIKHGENGFLVQHTPDSWYNQITTALANTPERHRIQRQAFKSVYKRFDMSLEWVRWARAYTQILSAPINPVKLPVQLPAKAQ